MAVALSITRERIAERPALAIGAALAGAMAGMAQAIGLLRWVFVIPGLAHAHTTGSADTRAAAERRSTCSTPMAASRSASISAS